MRSPVLNPSTPAPKRRALHERTQSQTNEALPSPTLRLVHDQEDHDVYAATPYPTKPEHVLLPKPGKGQGSPADDDVFFGVSHPSRNLTATPSSATPDHVADDRDRSPSIGDAWEVSSTVDAGHSPAQVWEPEDDPRSSRSSIPDPVSPRKWDEGPQTPAPSSSRRPSDDEVIVLPTVTPTIKTVLAEPSSSPPSLPAERAVSDSSSPNVVPIGLPSSPNFVPLQSSSPNLIPIGSSSPNLQTTGRQNSSSVSSLNSLGTVVRTFIGTAHWSRSRSSSENSSGQSQSQPSFRSSPPLPVLRSYPSTSTFALPGSRPATASTPSAPSAADAPAVLVDRGLSVQYPTIRAPSSSSWAESSSNAVVRKPSLRSMTDASSGRWNPHLSTVPSQWSAERQLSQPSPSAGDERSPSSFAGPSRPSATWLSDKTTSSVWIVTDPDSDERLDSLTNLPPSQLRSKNSLFVGSPASSRQNSLRSVHRPGSSSSLVLNTLPAWARVYYRSGELQSPPFPLTDSRPSSARPSTSNSYLVSRVPTAITRPRTRPREDLEVPQPRGTHRPVDRRNRWFDRNPDLRYESMSPDPHGAWSPHLHVDRRAEQVRGSMWTAPSLDSTAEPTFGRRNLQVYSFCLGFVFPLAWLIAAFLPLPPKPLSIQDGSSPEVAAAVLGRVAEYEARRYQNARWWRNLNRCMCPLGIAIIVIVVTLATVGTTIGF